MAALTATSWTVLITDRSIAGGKRRYRGTMALAGTDTYPTGGIPLPALAKFGFERSLDELRMSGEVGGITTKYMSSVDYVNNKLQFFEEEAAAAGGPLLECDTAEVPGPRTFNFFAEGW